MSRYLLACGGTGGHLAPGIALAEGLRAAGHECTLLISQKRVDARLVEKYPHLNLVRAPGAPFTLRPAGFLAFLSGLARGLVFSWRLVRSLDPDAVVAFGGFTTGAVALASVSSGVPIALHEANRIPGRAVRWLSPVADRVYLPPGVRLRRVPLRFVRHVGLPVRREFKRVARGVARGRLGFDAGQKLLLVLGGSQGARAMNDWVKQHLEFLAGEGIQVCCITGLGKGVEGQFEHRARNGAVVRSRFLPFTDAMADLLSAADLAVSRAGAGTIAELVRCNLPGILVPYPEAADDHQRANAAFFEQQGGGISLEQSFLPSLHREVMDILSNDWLLAKFRQNLRRMDREDVVDALVRDLEHLVQDRRPMPQEAAAPA